MVQGHSSRTGSEDRWVCWCPCPSAGTLLFSPGHTEKIYSIRFHPVAADLLVSSSYDMTVRIWELGAGQEVLCLQGHTDQVGEGITRGATALRHTRLPHCSAAGWQLEAGS